jgi:hypothetical protein
MNATAPGPRQDDIRANLFIAAVGTIGTVVLANSVRQILAEGLDTRQLLWFGLAILTVVVGPLSVKLPSNCRVSFSDVSIFLTLLAFGPHLAIATGALDGFASSARRGGVWYKTVFNTSCLAISVCLSSQVFTRLLPDGRLHGPGLSALDLVLPATAFVLVQYLVNTALVSTVVTLKDHVPLASTWRRASPWSGMACMAGSVAAAVVFLVIR